MFLQCIQPSSLNFFTTRTHFALPLSLSLFCSVTVPGYQGNLQSAISHSAALAAWERFGVEFILTFVVVLCYFVSTDAIRKFMGNSSFAIGAAYSACCFVSVSLTLIMTMLQECYAI